MKTKEPKQKKKRGRPKKAKTEVARKEKSLKGVPIEDLFSVPEHDGHLTRVSSLEVIDIPIDELIPSEWNPNEQKIETFNELVESIKEHGCDQPLIVVESKQEPSKYQIVGGEHRWRAMQALGLEYVPVVIKKDWDELKQKIECIRRNILTGELNHEKFTALVNSIIHEHDIGLENVSDLMGFASYAEFAANYLQSEEEKREKLLNNIDVAVDEAEAKLSHVDNLSLILQYLHTHFKHHLDGDFMYFMYRRRMHSYVKLNKEGKKAVDNMMTYLKNVGLEQAGDSLVYHGENINDFIAMAINNELARRNVDFKELEKLATDEQQKIKDIENEDDFS